MSAYEVQVCRVQLQSTSDDCGSCLLCFATTAAQGKCVLYYSIRLWNRWTLDKHRWKPRHLVCDYKSLLNVWSHGDSSLEDSSSYYRVWSTSFWLIRSCDFLRSIVISHLND